MHEFHPDPARFYMGVLFGLCLVLAVYYWRGRDRK